MTEAIDSSIQKCITGLCPGCERIVFTSVDLPERRKENAKEVARMVRDGIRIESWTVDAVRAGNWACECKKKTAKQPAQAALAL